MFCHFDHGSGHDCISQLDQCELIVTGVKELLRALAWIAGVELALEDAPNPACIAHSHWFEESIVDLVEDLLLRCDLHHVACFHHGCSCLGGYLDLQGRAGVVEN